MKTRRRKCRTFYTYTKACVSPRAIFKKLTDFHKNPLAFCYLFLSVFYEARKNCWAIAGFCVMLCLYPSCTPRKKETRKSLKIKGFRDSGYHSHFFIFFFWHIFAPSALQNSLWGAVFHLLFYFSKFLLQKVLQKSGKEWCRVAMSLRIIPLSHGQYRHLWWGLFLVRFFRIYATEQYALSVSPCKPLPPRRKMRIPKALFQIHLLDTVLL